jgi:hypothetical protein
MAQRRRNVTVDSDDELVDYMLNMHLHDKESDRLATAHNDRIKREARYKSKATLAARRGDWIKAAKYNDLLSKTAQVNRCLQSIVLYVNFERITDKQLGVIRYLVEIDRYRVPSILVVFVNRVAKSK